MPIKLQTTDLKGIRLGTTEVKKVMLGTTQIWVSGVKTWVYIGTSGSQNGTTNLGSSGSSSCRTSSQIQASLTANAIPSNYAEGYIMKADHSYEDPWFGTTACTSFYYQLQVL